jgi:hypothetical protein
MNEERHSEMIVTYSHPTSSDPVNVIHADWDEGCLTPGVSSRRNPRTSAERCQSGVARPTLDARLQK